jgi:hypothetical protein
MPKDISKLQNKPVLADESHWWQKGTELYEAFRFLEEWNLRDEGGRYLIVGESVAAMATSNERFQQEHRQWRRNLISEMLYAFAVEDWLKGILVASLHRESRQTYRRINAMIQERVDSAGDLDEHYTHRIIDAMGHEDISAEIARHDAQQATENDERVRAIVDHLKHNLSILAEVGGMNLTPQLRAHLDALMVINQLGRYPALVSEKPIPDLEPFVNNGDARAVLNRAVRERYDELLVLRFLRSGDPTAS